LTKNTHNPPKHNHTPNREGEGEAGKKNISLYLGSVRDEQRSVVFGRWTSGSFL